ncbi:MAG: hypothetical protein HYY06_09200 [Deltaproteobacteria bacterium]|nr:hypothetical protein [Deltaproteobacteria bacterium]
MPTDPDRAAIYAGDENTDLVQLAAPVRSRWEGRAATLQTEIDASQSAARVRALSAELGRIYEERLDRPDLAERAYGRALAVQPGASPAAALGIARIAARRGDWAVAAQALGALADSAQSPASKREVNLFRREVAKIHGGGPIPEERDAPAADLMWLATRGGDAAPAPESTARIWAPPEGALPEGTRRERPQLAQSSPAAEVESRARRAASSTTDTKLAVAILVRAAHDLRLCGELGAAGALGAEAARKAPGCRLVRDAACRQSRDEEDWSAFCLASIAEEEPQDRARRRRAIAASALRLAAGRAGDAARVLDAEAVPDPPEPDPLALSRALTDLAAERPLAAARRLSDVAARSSSSDGRAFLVLAAAEAAREAREPREAARLFDQAQRACPTSGFVHRRVAACLAELEQWGSLVSHLDASAEPDEAAAFWRHRAALVCLAHVGDRATAESLFRSSHRQWPAGVAPVVGLEALLRAEGRFAELDEVIAGDSSTSKASRIWRRMWLRRSGRIDAPSELCALLDDLHRTVTDPAEAAAATWLGQTILAEEERWAALVDALAREPARTERRVAIAYRTARARARIDAADDIAAALGASLQPDDEHRLLGRLHERLCYSGGHLGGLIDRWVALLEARPDQPALRARLAFLCLLGVAPPGAGGGTAEERSAASRVAAMCFAGLRDDPATWLALRPLAVVAALGTGSWEEVQTLLLDEVESAPAGSAFWALLTAAELAELRLGDPHGAIRHLERAEVIRPGTPAVVRQLLRLYRRAGRWTELESLVLTQARRLADAPVLPWLARLAMLDLDLRRDDDRALQTCRAILRDHPAFAPALRGIERLLLSAGLFGDLSETYVAASGALDGPARASCLRAALDAAELAERRDPAFEAAALAEITFEDNDRSALRRQLSICVDAPESRAQALLRCATATGTDADRAIWLAEAAEDCSRGGDSTRAIALAQAATRAAPEPSLPALLALAEAFAARATTQTDALVGLAGVFVELAQRLRDRENRKDAFVLAARLYDVEPSRHEDALRCTLEVLKIEPKNPDALSRLMALRAERKEWRELCDDLGGIIAADPDAPDTIVLLEHITMVLRDQLGRIDEAVVNCEAILVKNPRHATAVLWLARLHGQKRAWPEAAKNLERHLQLVADPTERIAAMRELAAIYHDRVANPVRAIAVLEELAVREPDQADHLRRLSQIHVNERQWAAAEPVTRRLAEKEPAGPGRIEAFVRLAQIRERGFSDPRGAVDWYRRALEVDPLRDATMNDLCACLQRAGDLRGVAVYRRQFTQSLREGLYAEPTRILWYRRLAENLAIRGLDLSCELVTSMIDWLESHGASGRSGRMRVIDADALRAVLRAFEVPPWAIALLSELETLLVHEHEWQPKKAGVRRTDRITGAPGNPVRERSVRICQALGLPELELYLFPVTPGLARAPLASEPTVVLDPEVCGLSEAVCRFTLAGAALRILGGMRLPQAFAPDALRALFGAVSAAIDPGALPAGLPQPDPGVVRRMAKRIPKGRRTEIALALRDCWGSAVGLDEVALRIDRALGAAAVAVCGSLAAGVEALARGAPANRRFDSVPEAVQLVRDALSEDFLSVVDRAPLA